MSIEKRRKKRDVLLISLSAFFADMGYQAILAGFPVLLVFVLHEPVYLLGVVYAVTYGGGAVLGFAGGIIGDRIGRKRTAIAGNIFILLLSLVGLATGAVEAAALYIMGWWSRDFRSPSRRAMLSDVTNKKERRWAFGMLHVFDIGGGAIAVTYLLVLLYLKVPIRTIFILTALPISISTVCLILVRHRARPMKQKQIIPLKKASGSTLKGILISTALFGFSFYSLGFPILTIAQESNSSILGILSYAIYLAFSAIAGYMIGVYARKLNMVKGLSVFGYGLAAIASLLIAVSYALGLAITFSYIAIALLGIAVGAIETFEPTIISLLSKKDGEARGMGYLTASRSIGLFTANVGMGLLYEVSPAYSYLYAFVISVTAAATMLYLGRGFG